MKWIWVSLVVVAAGCRPQTAESAGRALPPGVVLLGHIQHSAITESSGVVASRAHTNVFWTHTDGKRMTLVPMDRSGRALGEGQVTGAHLEDWEEISADEHGNLYIADTGNNDLRRQAVLIHQVKEPAVGQRSRVSASITKTWQLKFPKGPFDCESLFIWKDRGYVISKVTDDAQAGLYRFSLTNSGPQTLEHLGQLKIDSPVTGAALSADGSLLGIVAKNGAYVYRIDGDPVSATRGARPHHVKLRDLQIEGCAFVPEGLLATAESRDILLFTGKEFQSAR